MICSVSVKTSNKMVLKILKILLLMGISNVTIVEASVLPIYKCAISSGTICTFRDIVLNSTQIDWQPVADNPSIVETVIFTNCIIPFVTSNICKAFLNMKYLQMTNQKIKVILMDAFHACKNLTSLNLNRNLIEELNPDTFLYNENLESLILWENKINHLDSNLFGSLSNLKLLDLENNNLLEFSPDLVKSSANLNTIWLSSNDLSDVDSEQILQYLPNLEGFYLNGNEIACTRLVEVYQMFERKNIIFSRTLSYKTRYYPEETIFGNHSCNPDISFMASNYRKELLSKRNQPEEGNINQDLHETQILKTKIRINVEKVETKLSRAKIQIRRKFMEMNQRLDALNEKLQKLINLVQN